MYPHYGYLRDAVYHTQGTQMWDIGKPNHQVSPSITHVSLNSIIHSSVMKHQGPIHSPVPFTCLPSALLQDRSGMGTPTVPQRSRTLLPTALLTRATAVCTRGPWQRLSSASLNSTPERLSGAAHLSLVSMKARGGDGDFWNWTRSYSRQSQTQGLS